MSNNNSVFDKNSYVAFDGTSIRDLVISRLNQGQVFTDQNYQGSNISAIIDVISYTFSTLLYYLNKTSSESMFSESQIYENMNRIVKILNYNPVGRLTQNVPFTLSTTSSLSSNNYTIPRYYYINSGGSTYSLNQDVNFTKYLQNASEVISDISNLYLLYQGSFQENPQYTALGIDNEIVYISLPENYYIDHFNIFVYVKPIATGVWEEWTKATDLFLYSATDTVYTVRMNGNQNYEITFGDNINGKSLSNGDIVQVYYLKIDPNAQPLAASGLNDTNFIPYNTLTYNNIISDLNASQNYVTTNQLLNITVNNDYPSTIYLDIENVDSIRKNAPNAFRSQYRLVTINDYQTYVKTNYSNLLADVAVINNDDYLKEHIKYLYDIGLNQPQLENRILLNQVKFANNCNFNNIYFYFVPNSESQEYLLSTQKEMIFNDINENKTITSQLVSVDPVYMYLDFYVPNEYITASPNDLSTSKLVITKNPNSRRADSSIIADVQKVLSQTFNRQTNTLGQYIDIYELSTLILNIDGIKNIQTYRSDTNTYVEGISLLVWNNTYPERDSNVYSQNLKLKNFQYPIFNNLANISSRISVIDPTGVIKAADF